MQLLEFWDYRIDAFEVFAAAGEDRIAHFVEFLGQLGKIIFRAEGNMPVEHALFQRRHRNSQLIERAGDLMRMEEREHEGHQDKADLEDHHQQDEFAARFFKRFDRGRVLHDQAVAHGGIEHRRHEQRKRHVEGEHRERDQEGELQLEARVDQILAPVVFHRVPTPLKKGSPKRDLPRMIPLT